MYFSRGFFVPYQTPHHACISLLVCTAICLVVLFHYYYYLSCGFVSFVCCQHQINKTIYHQTTTTTTTTIETICLVVLFHLFVVNTK